MSAEDPAQREPANASHLTVTTLAEDPERREPAARKRRQRDPLFDALTEAAGIQPGSLTRSGRGALNGALKQLREVGATPDEIRVRAAEYRSRFSVPLTATALAKHWATLIPSRREVTADDGLSVYVRA